VNNFLAFAKDVENQITDRRKASNEIVEYKENRSWILKCYKLWLRACLVKSLNPKVTIYQREQMKNENIYYFIEKKYDFTEDEETVQKQLKEFNIKSDLLQKKLKNMKTMGKEMGNFNADDYNIPRLMMRLKKSVYSGLENIYDELLKKGEICKHM
jgi:hypothetical protein